MILFYNSPNANWLVIYGNSSSTKNNAYAKNSSASDSDACFILNTQELYILINVCT